jgi:hypothetical protein
LACLETGRRIAGRRGRSNNIGRFTDGKWAKAHEDRGDALCGGAVEAAPPVGRVVCFK